MIQATPRVLNSLKLNGSSLLIKNLEANDMGFHPLTVRFSGAVARPEQEASQLPLVLSCGLQ